MDKVKQNIDILVYTREAMEEYTESLSNSIHLAYSVGSSVFTALNQNYGILFASATVDEQNVIHEKGLKNPFIFRMEDDSFGILAIRVDKNGRDDIESKGHILLWTSKDLITFHSYGLIKLHDDFYVKEAVCEYNHSEHKYEIRWQDKDGKFYINKLQDITRTDSVSVPVMVETFKKEQPCVSLTNIRPGNIIRIDQEIGNQILRKWKPIYNTEMRLPDSVTVASISELQTIMATAVYSDGSTAKKQVLWDDEGIDFSTAGIYEVKGKVAEDTYPFPLANGYADPVILTWNNKYYYLATNDNVNDIGMFVREGNTISELFAPGFKESLILNVDEEKGFIQTFWAPEFHRIGSDLYILFAVSGKVWGPQCHIMKLKKGGDIMKPEDWEVPVRVRRADNTFLAEDGITLDMTYFKANGTSCMVWSYRKDIGTPLDTGSMLYIATVDEKDPTILTSEPVLLTRPIYGWENIQGTINNEGPYALLTKDRVYITYSGGAAGGYTYALGLLSISCTGNFLDDKAWIKASTPVLSYYSIDGIYGPGHNSFFQDYNGNIMIMYHGEVKIAKEDTRCTGMHRVHFNIDHEPVFDVAKERELNPLLSEVSIKVVIN